MSGERALTLEEILAATGGAATVRGATSFPGGVGIDGRQAKAGSLYAAIIGERHDGHDFSTQAVAAGATGVLVQRGRTAEQPKGVTVVEVDDTRVALGQIARSWRRRHGARVVGVTGSAGKTTTKELCAAALAAVGPTLAAAGSLNNETGVPLTLLGIGAAHRFAVVEMGMRGLGQIAYLRGLVEPDVAVVVNAGIAHVGVVGSAERIAQGKSEIWLGMGQHPERRAVLPAGDARLAAWARQRGAGEPQVLTFGEEPGATVRVAEVAARGAEGSDVTFEVAGGRKLVARVPLPGRHNAGNAACALAVALALGVDVEAAARGLGTAKPAEHRSAVREIGGRHLLDDCYNANPASMAAAIETLVELARGGSGGGGGGGGGASGGASGGGGGASGGGGGASGGGGGASGAARAVAVVGDMLELGDEAAAAHRAIGRKLGERGVAHVVALGAHAAHVVAGLADAGRGTPHDVTDDPLAAAKVVARVARPGDWVLVKASRGMRLERVIDALMQELG